MWGYLLLHGAASWPWYTSLHASTAAVENKLGSIHTVVMSDGFWCAGASAPTPADPPPVLAEGDDDIFWVNQLHVRTPDPCTDPVYL